jgi:hypothetical protein
VVAVPVDARRWYEAGQAVEQFEGPEAKLMAAVDIGLGKPVHQAGLRRGEGLDTGGGVKPLQGERPPGAVVRIPTEVATRFRRKWPGDSDRCGHPIPREVATPDGMS